MRFSEFLESRRFGLFISVVILFSVVCFSLETLPDLSPSSLRFLQYAEICVVTIFVLEYIARVATAEHKLKFIFSFYGVIDLLAILPSLLSTTLDLRSLRLLRILRLLRLLKLGRYSRAVHRFNMAIYESKEELIIFLFLSVVVLYLSAVGIYYFEHEAQPQAYKSIFDCLWWSVATLTTVGYGDIYPVTVGGRTFTFVVLMLGLGLVAVPTGIVASSLAALREQEAVEKGSTDSEGPT